MKNNIFIDIEIVDTSIMSHLYVRPDAKVPSQMCFVDTEEKLSDVCNEILQLAEHNQQKRKNADKSRSSSDDDEEMDSDENDDKEREDGQV